MLHDGAAVTGWAALHWQRARWFSGFGNDGVSSLDVPVVTKRFIRAQAGVEVSQEFLGPGDTEWVDRIVITRSVRSVAFVARRSRTLVEAVTAIDMAAYSDLVSLAELELYVDGLGPITGVGRLRDALALADENAWSPTEVTMRLVWLGEDHARPLTNVPIFDEAGRHVATVDLLDPEAGVAGEYEGGVHLVGSRRAHDVAREGVLLRHGLQVVTMVASDLIEPSEFCRRLRDAYRRAGEHRIAAPGRRSWTIEPPAWWQPTLTVDQRRTLSAADRERLLAHRRAS